MEAPDHRARSARCGDPCANEAGEAVHLRRVVIERGDVLEVDPAGGDKGRGTADRDLLEGLQAIHREAGAGDCEARDARLCERAQPVFRVGPEPARAADARLERDRPARRRQREPSGDEPRCREALRAVRIAPIRVALRDAVEGKQQVVERRARRADARCKRFDVAGFGVVFLDREPCGRRGPARERRVHAVERCGGRGRRVLRIERQHDDPRRAGGAQLVERVADGGIAVGHAHGDHGRLGLLFRELAPERPRQCLGAGEERRPGRRPDLLVGVGAPCGPERQDEAAQDDLPGNPRQVDDAPVGQEFREEAPHGLGRRRIRRAEVDDEDAGRGGHGITIPQGPRVRYEGGGRKKAAGRKPPGRASEAGAHQLRRTPANSTFASSPMR